MTRTLNHFLKARKKLFRSSLYKEARQKSTKKLLMKQSAKENILNPQNIWKLHSMLRKTPNFDHTYNFFREAATKS